MSTVYLGLGSNLGDRLDNIEQAVASLEDNGILILKQSTIIETEPVGGPPQEKFLNAVVQALTDLAPDKLLTVLKSIEKQQGRVKTVANGPRPIDLDILLYDDTMEIGRPCDPASAHAGTRFRHGALGGNRTSTCPTADS